MISKKPLSSKERGGASRPIPTEYHCNNQDILYYTENTEYEEAMATKVSTAEFIRHFGRFHDQAQKEPIVLTKHGRDTVVVLSKEEFERMQGNGDPRRVFAMGETPADLAEVLLNGLDSQIAELEAKADE
ncbi:type II toxin-antitoxin system prevent-host-death family antitoxin [Phyllobacterium sp. TAF24]|uniref:type II toxin-antitoxin system prevent-host-death family antitoxin n=1 Tax=Phyllobacterium sp. TAF24 TaxID=3233068 RepID=UPI003F9B8C5A